MEFQQQCQVDERINMCDSITSRQSDMTMNLCWDKYSSLSHKDNRFQFCDLPREMQLEIFARLYCTRPWQLALVRDHESKSTSFEVTKRVGPMHILHQPEFRELFEAIISVSKNGSLLFADGCTWDVQEDVETIEGLKVFTNSVTTVILEQRLGDPQQLCNLRTVCPKLKNVELNIGANPVLNALVQVASSEMMQSFVGRFGLADQFYLDPLLLGYYDRDICDMLQECLTEFTRDEQFNPAMSEIVGLGESLLNFKLNLTVGVPLNSVLDAGSRIRTCADFMAIDLVMENGVVQMTGKWFVDILNNQYTSAFALVEEDDKDVGRKNEITSWKRGPRLDVVGKYLPFEALKKKIILLVGTFYE